MLMGIAMHEAFEAHHLGRDPETALMQAWESAQVRGYLPPKGALQRAFEAVRAYRYHNPRDQRDRPEKKFSITVQGISVPIIGRLDLIRGDEIQEMKSGKKKWWTQQRVDTQIQPGIYWMAYRAMLGFPPQRVVYHIVPTQPVVQPAFTLETVRSEQQLAQLCDHLRRVWGEICTGELRAGCRLKDCAFPAMCAAWRTDDDERSGDDGAIHLQP
jgi:hypothetical protein